MLRITTLALAALLTLSTTALEASETLRGSRGSMIRQNRIAKEQDFTFLRTPAQVERFVEEGYLVEVEGNADYGLSNVSFPFARPALRTFVERLAAQYHEGCGEKLVVTSLTRPRSLQPSNSHDLSVHPAGMAVDLRVSDRTACRAWLEETLLSLEADGMLDITRERRPPHYHVAVFPEAYMAHVGRLLSDSLRVAEEREALAARQRADALARAAAAGNALAAVPAVSAPTDEDEDEGSSPWLPLALLVMAGAALVDRGVRGRKGARDDS